MNATKLFHADGKPAGIWYCTACRLVARTQDAADRCCMPVLCACGVPVKPGWTICSTCCEAAEAAKEKARFEKATKLTNWDGPVMTPAGDFLEDLDTLVEADDEPPAYVWVCNTVPVVVLDLDNVLEDATQAAYDGFTWGDLTGVAELGKALEAFNVANAGVVEWELDYTRAVTVTPQTDKDAGKNTEARR